MSTVLRILLTFALAMLAGSVVGWAWLAPRNRPPALPRVATPRIGPAAVAPATDEGASRPQHKAGDHGTQAGRPNTPDELGEGMAAQPGPKPTGAKRHGDTSPADRARRAKAPNTATTARPGAKGAEESGLAAAPVLVPAETDRQGDDDIDLLPRGPNAWVDIDLAGAQTTTLTIRAGTLARDGAGAWRSFAKARRVGTLRGRTARVALLHLGFDRGGQPVIAHIRTNASPPVEGIIPLQIGDHRLGLRKAPADLDSSSYTP